MSHGNFRKNPHRLFRDKKNGRVAGVCAGIADYFGFNITAIRLLTAFSMLFFWPILIYILLAFLLPVKPADLYENVEQANFWREVSIAPSDIFGELRHRFRGLEMRLRSMEAFITSREFEIDSELSGTRRKN